MFFFSFFENNKENPRFFEDNMLFNFFCLFFFLEQKPVKLLIIQLL